MQGYRGRALKAAKKARKLAPELERTETVLGFAALAAIDIGRAKQAFRRAIALNSADPQARFGLGLATIRGGDLERGTRRHRARRRPRPRRLAAPLLPRQGLLRRADHQPADLLRELFTQLPQPGEHAGRRAVRHRQAPRSQRPDAVALRRHPQAEREPPGRGAARHREVDRAQRQPRRLPLARAARPGPGGARHQPRPHLQRPRLRAARHQRGDQVAHP